MSKWSINAKIDEAISNDNPQTAFEAFALAAKEKYQIPFEKRISIIEVIKKGNVSTLQTYSHWSTFQLTLDERCLLLFHLCDCDENEAAIKQLISQNFVFTQRELIILVAAILRSKFYPLLRILDQNYGLPKYIADMVAMAGVEHALEESSASST